MALAVRGRRIGSELVHQLLADALLSFRVKGQTKNGPAQGRDGRLTAGDEQVRHQIEQLVACGCVGNG